MTWRSEIIMIDLVRIIENNEMILVKIQYTQLLQVLSFPSSRMYSTEFSFVKSLSEELSQCSRVRIKQMISVKEQAKVKLSTIANLYTGGQGCAHRFQMSCVSRDLR